jgi:hypothetical protein
MAVLALFWLFPTRRCSGEHRGSNIEGGRFIVREEQMITLTTAMPYPTTAIGEADHIAALGQVFFAHGAGQQTGDRKGWVL